MIQRIAGSRPSRSASHALVPGEATEHGLEELRGEAVATIASGARVDEDVVRHLGQPERLVQIAEGEETGVGGDPRAEEL